MRELILMRHAEALPATPGAADFSRPLSNRGVEEASAAALRLLQQHGQPDCVLCSPAVRTTATASAVRTTLRLDDLPLRTDPRIYLATPGQLLQVVAESPEAARRVLLIGHNPAVSQLAAALQAGNGRSRSLATAEFRHFNLPVQDWQALREPA
jgi:phosphohistidine phosphatase SixA